MKASADGGSIEGCQGFRRIAVLLNIGGLEMGGSPVDFTAANSNVRERELYNERRKDTH